MSSWRFLLSEPFFCWRSLSLTPALWEACWRDSNRRLLRNIFGSWFLWQMFWMSLLESSSQRPSVPRRIPWVCLSISKMEISGWEEMQGPLKDLIWFRQPLVILRFSVEVVWVVEFLVFQMEVSEGVGGLESSLHIATLISSFTYENVRVIFELIFESSLLQGIVCVELLVQI